jgi:pyruvate/2-oxoglutarate dehydrogenase complex dihydrolipoamide acyltransferase (E2) component
MKTSPVARQRRHTLYFLNEIKTTSPVFIDTEIDMSSVERHRSAEKERGQHFSRVAYVVFAAARALAVHPEANVGLRGRMMPRLARYPMVNVKLAMDKTIGGQRAVLATVIPNADTVELETIQKQIDHFRAGDPETMPEWSTLRLLHKLPWPIAWFLFSRNVRSLRKRHELFGTLAVTSLGHRPVDGFQSVGGTPVTLGVGRVMERPVVGNGQIVVAPVMRLSLAFDHRAIDGGEAADLLADIRAGLETFSLIPVG